MEQWKNLFCLGVVAYLGFCTLLPLTVWLYYRKSRREIGRSVGWMAFGEFFSMLVALIFACCEYAGVFSQLDWRLTSAMRVIMGTVAFCTTIHLARSTYHAVIDYENDRS